MKLESVVNARAEKLTRVSEKGIDSGAWLLSDDASASQVLSSTSKINDLQKAILRDRQRDQNDEVTINQVLDYAVYDVDRKKHQADFLKFETGKNKVFKQRYSRDIDFNYNNNVTEIRRMPGYSNPAKIAYGSGTAQIGNLNTSVGYLSYQKSLNPFHVEDLLFVTRNLSLSSFTMNDKRTGTAKKVVCKGRKTWLWPDERELTRAIAKLYIRHGSSWHHLHSLTCSLRNLLVRREVFVSEKWLTDNNVMYLKNYQQGGDDQYIPSGFVHQVINEGKEIGFNFASKPRGVNSRFFQDLVIFSF